MINASTIMPKKTADTRIQSVTLKGVLINTLLTLFKFLAAILGHSAAMLSDAVHSLSDLATDIIVLVLMKPGLKSNDATHDYGRGKYGTVAALITGIIIGFIGLWLCHHGVTVAIRAIHGQVLQQPGYIALIAALVSIVVKEWLYRITLPVVRKTGSQVLAGNAWHHRSDAISSIGTFIGIFVAIFFGVRWRIVDPITSVVVSVFIIRIAWLLILNAVRDLSEHSLPDEIEAEIAHLAEEEPGVKEVRKVLSRRVGQSLAIELLVAMPGALSVTEAHRHALRIEEKLKEKYDNITHVGIHIVPEDYLA